MYIYAFSSFPSFTNIISPVSSISTVNVLVLLILSYKFSSEEIVSTYSVFVAFNFFTIYLHAFDDSMVSFSPSNEISNP